MVDKKQSGNFGGSGGADPVKAAAAREKFAALFRDAPEPPHAAVASPITWTRETLGELRKVKERLKGFRGNHSGDFATISDEDTASSPGLVHLLDAFGRAKNVLIAFQFEMEAQGKSFGFSSEVTGKKQGTITVSDVSYALIEPFISEKLKSLTHAASTSPTTPGKR